MVKAKRTEDGDIGGDVKVVYAFRVTLEHAAFLDRIIAATQKMPADWLTEVLREELARVGVEVSEADVGTVVVEPVEKQGVLFR